MSEPSSREHDDARTVATVSERGDGYVRNGVWVPRNQDPDPRPPHWRERLRAKIDLPWNERRVWIAAAAGLGALIVLAAVVATPSPAEQPRQQRDFLATVKQGQEDVRDGNDLTLVTAEQDRREAICDLLPRGGAVGDWVGTIDEIGTVSGGTQGYLSIAIGNDVHLRTWERTSEDGRDRTLVRRTSEVYRSLADLESGDEVQFSGAFVPQGATCINETSRFARNGMLTPSFVFRFTAVGTR